MAIGDDGIERLQNPIAIRIGNDERRKKFDGMACMPGNLAKNPVILKKWDRDELAKQPFICGLKDIP
jgi:hypothetical protein